MVSTFIIVFLGMLLGNIIAVLFPYFRKLSEGTIDKFDFKYIYHLVLGVVWNGIFAILAKASAWQVPENAGSVLVVLFFAVFFGYGGNNAQKGGEKYWKLIKRLQNPNVIS